VKTKVLSLLTTTCVLAWAAWLVHQGSTSEFNSHALSPVMQAAESSPAQEVAVPEKYRDTIHKGLEYLAKHQFKDGHWEGDEGKHPTAMTALVGLAFFMERDGRHGRVGRFTDRETKHSAEIRKAVDWLMDKSQTGRDGLIFSEHPSETARYMEGHGLATLFLAGACEDEKDGRPLKKLTNVLTRAVKYIARAQSTQGGWYHTSKVEGHDFDTIAATAIQFQALQAAENASIPIPGDTVDEARGYLEAVLPKYKDGAKSGQGRGQPADIAAALACRGLNARSRRMAEEEDMRDTCFRYCQTEIPRGRNMKFGRDELTHYFYAQALLNLGRQQGHEAWNDYRTEMFDHLQRTQNQDGSWPAGDGISVGAVYSTAVWCIVLQLDNASHPSMLRVPMSVK
jgi:hypothetical protein